MLQQKAFVKKTRKGGVVKVVKEHYLRDDIPSATPLDPACPPDAAVLSPAAARYLVVDTNAALHAADVLAHPAVTDVILCSTVLDEVRHRDAAAAGRLRALAAPPSAKRVAVFPNEHHAATFVKARPGETPNDRNDRAVRAVAAWYGQLVAAAAAAAAAAGDTASSFPVVTLLTDDRACAAAAAAEGVPAVMTVAEYAASRAADAPELADLVPRRGATGGGDPSSGRADAAARRPPHKRARVYDDHRPLADVTAALKAGALHQGVLRVARFAKDEAWVGARSSGADILVRGKPAFNRAFDGDVVAVELLPEEEWVAPSSRLAAKSKQGGDGDAAAADAAAADDDRPSAATALPVDPADADDAPSTATPPPNGRVVAIIRRGWRARGYPGAFLPPPAGRAPPPPGTPTTALFAPADRKLPLIRVETRQLGRLLGCRVIVAVDAWPADADAPVGHFVRSLGPLGDKAAETEALLLEHDVPDAPFTADVLACVPRLPWSVSAADRTDPRREDWTAVPVVSVDPPGCTDIDDALHVRPLPGGADADGYEFEVGVHIADVGHFLTPGSPADLEAARRGTSVYLVGRRIDMLPKALTEDICSLRSGVERLAFSVTWRAARDGRTSAPRFFKSVIKPVASLTYAEAQAMIDDPNANDDVSVALKTLATMTDGMRARRVAAGALTLASPEVRFELDTDTHDPLDVGMYVTRRANGMVEEMMLLANCAAAAVTLAAFPGAAMLRRHPAPPPAQFAPLLAAASAAGVRLDVSSSLALAGSLDRAVREADPYFNRLLRILATRCMTPAAYYAAGAVPHPPDRAHYGLACPLYTHFTSPIRRYADVIVHRLLAAAIGAAPPPPGAADPRGDAHAAVADVANARHRGAQLAARASVDLHTLLFFRGAARGAGAADARVVRVRANGVVVFVPKYGIEGPAFYADAVDGWLPGLVGGKEEGDWILSADGCAASPPGASSPTIRVFDPVAVRIAVDDGGATGRARLVLTLVGRGELKQEDEAAV